MPIGWTVEVTIEHQDPWRPTSRRRRFDVAIEDKARAVEAVRRHVRATSIAAIVVIEQLHHGYGLSPGRIRSR
jgi:hypothetical protein